MEKHLKLIIFPVIIFFLLHGSLSAQEASVLKLWYDKPATRFEEALPLGNGRIGIMVYGGVNRETINLNEESLWGGGPTNTSAPANTVQYLAEVREQLFKENWGEASKILRNIQGANSQSFVPMGDIVINQQYGNGDVRNYRRELDLSNAISITRFSIDTIDYVREAFVSAPDQIVVIKLTASKKGGLNFSVTGNTQFEGATIKSVGSNEFVLSGQLPTDINSARNFPLVYTKANGQKGMRYQYRVKAILEDGTVTTDPSLQIKNATQVTLLISMATSFNGFDKRPDTQGKDEEQAAINYLNKAELISYEILKQKHIEDYQSYFNRVKLDLGSNDAINKPTDARLIDYAKGNPDPALESLYFHFGRYLLISSSRSENVTPANLQGIWNKNQRPSWGSNYTTNINIQMNYWPAEMLNMSEMTDPLIRFIQNLSITGTQVAKNYYNMRGWAAHHNSDIWAHANPVGHQKGDPKWANWSLGSPWLSQHLYEHYRFTNDKKYLTEKAYPLMKSAADFCLDWLVAKDGYWVTAPSTSPENVFIDDAGNKGVVTIASTMDMEIVWDLLTNLIEASEILDVDKADRQKWTDTRAKLYPLRIGKEGNLIEWYKDWKDEDPQHRHVSHLFGLHPGRQISPILTPELAKACKKTLEMRGDGGTGWSKAWKVNFQARLLDGEHAYKMYRELLSTSTLPNLFDTHPPFQIDGNFGGISGVGEMLIQSHLDEIHLLPAMPASWSEGEVSGLCARGAFVVDMKWKNSKLVSGKIVSRTNRKCIVRTNSPVKIKGVSSTSKKDGAYFITSFYAKSGGSYLLTDR